MKVQTTDKKKPSDFLHSLQESNPKEDKETDLINSEDKSESIDKLKADYIEEVVIKKERKPRTPKAKVVEPVKPVIDTDFAKSITGVGSLLMDMIIKRLPNPEPLSISEKSQIDGVFDAMALKYSVHFGKFKEEIAFLMVVGIIVVPRLNNSKKDDKHSENRDENKS